MIRHLTLAAVAAVALLVANADSAQAGSKFRITIAPGVKPAVQGQGLQYPARYTPVQFPVQTPVQGPAVFPTAPRNGFGPGPQQAPAHFHVLFRRCEHDPWQQYGTYDCHEEAHAAQEQLIRRGFQAKVVHH